MVREIAIINSPKLNTEISRIRLHLSLMKIPLSLFISISALFGYVLHTHQITSSLLLTGAGVFLLACGGAALNNLQDREYDRLLIRTRNRPLPSGRLPAGRSIMISTVTIPSGLILLHIIDGKFLLPGLGVMAILLYNGVYTPLKHRIFFSLSAGAACGMIPPLIGWAAAGGNVFSFKIILIMTIFGLWQMPHFWLVVLNHKADYLKSGIPSMVQFFTIRRLEKMVFIWILNFAVMLQAVPVGYMVDGLMPGSLIIITAIGLTLITFKNIFLSPGRQNYHRIFISLNCTMLFVMIIVISDCLFCR